MSLLNKELYEALREANVSEEKATAAAAADQEVPHRLAKIEARLDVHDKLLWATVAGIIGLLLKAYVLT